MEADRFRNYRNGIKLAGNLYLPTDFDKSKKYPAIIVTHPGGGVKEQTAGFYAGELCRLGYIALAYDASYQGESGGTPHYLDDPFFRSDDNSVAADYLLGQACVDGDKLGILGICAGGNAVNAACGDHRLRCVATVSAFNVGAAMRSLLNENDLAAINETILISNRARTIEANGGKSEYATYVPETKDEAKASGSVMMYEAWEYYRTPRGEHPNSPNKVDISSFMDMYRYDAFVAVPWILTQPLLMIAGSKAESLIYSEQCIEVARRPKELCLIDGATHVDLYDNPKYTGQGTEKLAEFFAAHIGPAAVL